MNMSSEASWHFLALTEVECASLMLRALPVPAKTNSTLRRVRQNSCRLQAAPASFFGAVRVCKVARPLRMVCVTGVLKMVIMAVLSVASGALASGMMIAFITFD